MKKERIAQYVYRDVNSEASMLRLHTLCRDMGLRKNIVEDLHVTSIYSNQGVMDHFKIDQNNFLFSGVVVPTLWETQEGTLFLIQLKDGSEFLHERFNYFRSVGGKNNFPDYNPHVSLTYDVPVGYNHPMLDKPYVMSINFGKENYEDVYEKWKPKLQ